MNGARQTGGTRRNFLEWLIGGASAVLAGAILYPIIRYLVPPAGGQKTLDEVTLSIAPDQIGPNTGRIFRFGDHPGLLLRTPTGDLRAFSAVCTHLGCTVQYRPDLLQIWCPCHNGHYDLNGNVVSGPPPKPLPEYTVVVQGQAIVVRAKA
jgi:cytochrome b6-f complex iron-sulfur subunit